MALIIVKGDIFTTGAKYIAHQCNAVSTNSAGIAKEIFSRFSYADCYKNRTSDANISAYGLPGTIQVCGDGLKERGIINIFAQHYPGSANSNTEYDTFDDRKKWFYNCLLKIAEIDNLDSVAFPYKIGCSLAGGDWNWYFKKLVSFEKYVERKAKVLIYKNESE